jgi:hypothetical protein
VTIQEIAEILEATIIACSEDTDANIKSACSADMMSAVLYYHTAEQKKIPLLCTRFCMYTASGKLFEAGLPGCLNK